MKIYNEVITIFNESNGKWETISEDSFEYNGPMAMAQGLPPNATAISSEDTIADTIKTTAGYFTNGDGTLNGDAVHTGSLTDSNESYYFNVTQAHPDSSSAEVQFSVTFGHYAGSGSNQYGDSTTTNQIYGASQAIYKQLTNLLLEETEASGGFMISQQGSYGDSLGTGVKDEYVYALIGKRERFKDRMNKKTWTLSLSGSTAAGAGTGVLKLTDDSANVAATATPAGDRYNIVSGALGTVVSSSTEKTYGWFYPEMGIMLFSGHELSASIPGPGPNSYSNTITNIATSTASFHANDQRTIHSSSGFAPNLDPRGNVKNALKLVACMQKLDANNSLRLRSEEDQTQENYFCRIKAGDYNFSANPSFVSGSLNKLRHTSMHGNPTTFITGVGLYNSAGQLLATSKLSSPLKKNFASEATVKVKLTY